MFPVSNLLRYLSDGLACPSLWIRHGVAEHVEEDGLGEGVELCEGHAALGPQRVRFVQDLRNPLLLGEGWERYAQTSEEVFRNAALPGAARHSALTFSADAVQAKKVRQVPCVS